MPNVILLTDAKVAALAAIPPVGNAALVPIPLGGIVAAFATATHYVGPEVLTDPAFAPHAAVLAGSPQTDFASNVAPNMPKMPNAVTS